MNDGRSKCSECGSTPDDLELARRIEALRVGIVCCKYQDGMRYSVDFDTWRKFRPTVLDALRAAHIGDPEPEPTAEEIVAFCERIGFSPHRELNGTYWMWVHVECRTVTDPTWRGCVVKAMRAEWENKP
jgi:hypothetical protein